VTLAYANIHFYFYKYYADPENLTNERYKIAQRLYEVQTIQSRYMASLGVAYRVIVVGKSPYPYDPEITAISYQTRNTSRHTIQKRSYHLLPPPERDWRFCFSQATSNTRS
jgi:hypothetical protein